MKPKPFASLNHFTVPFATCNSFYLAGASPLHHALYGRPARPLWSGFRTTNRPDTTMPQATSSAARIPTRESGMNRQDNCLRKEYRSKHVGSQHKSWPRCYSLRLMQLRGRKSPRDRALARTPIRELGLRLEGSPIEPLLQKLGRELRKRLERFRPQYYLTDEWGCPSGQPVIGIPFYLADRKLARIEKEANDLETQREILMYLRHE